MRALLASVLTGVCCLCTAGVALAAQMLVVIDAHNADDALKPGIMISADAAVTLAAGARLSLLSESGRLVVLTGPYEGKADTRGQNAGAPEAATVMTKLSRLIAGQKSTVVTGAARSIAGGKDGRVPPHPAFISLEAGGEKCALSRWPELWRSDSKNTVSLTLTNRQGLVTALDWPAGENRIDLPSAYLEDGATVTANLAGRAVDLHLNVHPGNVRNPTEVFAWMADKGCTEQASALLAALRKKAQGQR